MFIEVTVANYQKVIQEIEGLGFEMIENNTETRALIRSEEISSINEDVNGNATVYMIDGGVYLCDTTYEEIKKQIKTA